jgi:hypothetical protein
MPMSESPHLEEERVIAKLMADNGVQPFVLCMMLDKSRGKFVIAPEKIAKK